MLVIVTIVTSRLVCSYQNSLTLPNPAPIVRTSHPSHAPLKVVFVPIETRMNKVRPNWHHHPKGNFIFPSPSFKGKLLVSEGGNHGGKEAVSWVG